MPTRTGILKPKELIDAETGEAVMASIIHIIEKADEDHYVNVFADGVKAAFDLTKTGYRLFQTVLQEYQSSKMTGGYSDMVALFFLRDGLTGAPVDMSKNSFQSDLKRTHWKSVLYPETPNQYQVNPALFFKGDRIAFTCEYRKTPKGQTNNT